MAYDRCCSTTSRSQPVGSAPVGSRSRTQQPLTPHSFFADNISPTYRHLLYSGHLVLISSEGLLMSVVYFNVWVEAVSLPVQSEMIHGGVYYSRTKTYLEIIQMFAPGLGATFSRDQRGLRTASIAAGLLSLVSIVLVILGCLEKPLWISLATV